MIWDEENRLLAVSDNGFVSSYFYDAAGERTVKMSGEGEGVYVNGALSGARTGTTNFTAYISPYMLVRNGGYYTKNVYMGSERIVSKLSSSDIFATTPVTTNQQQAKYSMQTAKIKERYDSLGVVYRGTEKTGSLITSDAGKIPTPLSYFYHPDHLGSSSLITDQAGSIVQHLEYVPFGETFIDERNGNWSTPYTFSGKERDEETGLLYVHARYQDSKYGIWYSVDQLAEKYPNMSSYVYCLNNPVKYVDPDGRDWVSRNVDGNTEVYYDRKVKSQDDVNKKYGENSGVTHLKDGSKLKVYNKDGSLKDSYTFKNDHKSNKHGVVTDKNGNVMDNSKIIYGSNYTIFGTSDNSCDAETLHKNLLGTSYTGGKNPKDYNKDDSYQYQPRNASEYPSMAHDLEYDDANTSGLIGALLDPRVIGADVRLTLRNARIATDPSIPKEDRKRAAKTAAAFGVISLFKISIWK